MPMIGKAVRNAKSRSGTVGRQTTFRIEFLGEFQCLQRNAESMSERSLSSLQQGSC